MLSSKSPLLFPQSQNSLPRINREQGLNYRQEICGEDIQFDIKINGNSKKQLKQDKVQSVTKMNYYASQDNSPTQDSRKQQARVKLFQKKQHLTQKVQGNRRDASPLTEFRSLDKKRNLLDLNCIQVDQNVAPKDKKDKITMDEQNTKKIQFQDRDGSRDDLRKKKNSATKIKGKQKQDEIDSWKQGILQLNSNQSSELQFQGESSLLFQKVSQNNKLMGQQIKQMMVMIKWEFIEAEKIYLRTFLSKLDGEIRKLKIGFRGLSQSSQARGLASKLTSKSKIKPQKQPLPKEKIKACQQAIARADSGIQKEQMQKKHHLLLKDYGFDHFETQRSNQLGFQQSEKLQKLTQQLEMQTKLSAKLALDYNEVSARLKRARQQYQLKGSDSILKTECKVSTSVIKSSKLIKEKLVFLKNEIRQTRSFYSNRIKRLKNENTIIYNEALFLEKEIAQIRAALNSRQTAHLNNFLLTLNSNPKRLKCVNHQDSKQYGFLVSNAKTASSQKEITTVKSAQSLENLKPMQSINSIQSAESSKYNQANLKPKKSQHSQRLSCDYQIAAKPKLKINSPHLIPVGNGANVKQYSIISKRKKETAERISRSGGERNSSLDIAFKELQRKYQIQTQESIYQAEYYGSKY